MNYAVNVTDGSGFSTAVEVTESHTPVLLDDGSLRFSSVTDGSLVAIFCRGHWLSVVKKS